MKTIIVYASSHGTTEKVANMIAQKLVQDDPLVINLKKSEKIDLIHYDQIIIGGSIHAGQMQGAVKSFCKKNLNLLMDKKVALFMCGLNKPELETEFINAFPETLREHAFTSKIVGGEYVLGRMNFIEKYLIKKIAKVTESASYINYEKIDELVGELKKVSDFN